MTGPLLLALSVAAAHESGPTRVDVYLDPGRYRIDVELHAPAWRPVASQYWSDALAGLPAELEISIDGDPLAPPALDTTWRSGEQVFLARYRGTLPIGSENLGLWAGAGSGPWLVTVEAAGREPAGLLVVPGERQQIPLDGVAPEHLPETVGRYAWLGFIHIVPRGLDHILFVLGLFLLAHRRRDLLLQISAFTVAHTLTLGAGLLGWVQVPAGVVEPAIAASIAWVGVENVVVREVRAWRPLLVFGFGLLHGLGFAGVLAELGLPPGQRVAALLSFNVGVELGQLLVVAVAFMLVGRWWNAPWYRRRVVVPGSVAIAAMGVFWMAQRLG